MRQLLSTRSIIIVILLLIALNSNKYSRGARRGGDISSLFLLCFTLFSLLCLPASEKLKAHLVSGRAGQGLGNFERNSSKAARFRGNPPFVAFDMSFVP